MQRGMISNSVYTRPYKSQSFLHNLKFEGSINLSEPTMIGK
jgi:hypothetical protein